MSKGINRCTFIGNLGSDPEQRSTQSGSAVTTISLAVSESWKDKQTGKTQERVEWIRIVFFNRLAEIAGEYLKKGSKVYIEGSLRTRKWEKNGQDMYTTEIVASEMQMLDSRQSQGYESHQRATPPQDPAGGGSNHGGKVAADFEDSDLPF